MMSESAARSMAPKSAGESWVIPPESSLTGTCRSFLDIALLYRKKPVPKQYFIDIERYRSRQIDMAEIRPQPMVPESTLHLKSPNIEFSCPAARSHVLTV